MNESREQLLNDAREWSLYLIGRVPSDAQAERYADAIARLSVSPSDARYSRTITFVRKHPTMVGALESACAWLDPQNPLRRRLLVLTAVLETTTEHADKFLPEHKGRLLLFFTIAYLGISSIAKTVVGALLLTTVVRR